MAENPSAEAPPANRWQFISLFAAAPKSGVHDFFGCFFSAQNLTRGLDAVDERLHLIVAFGFICVEVGAGADHAASPVSELTVGRVLLLTLVGT